jgi:hypothetical protein
VYNRLMNIGKKMENWIKMKKGCIKLLLHCKPSRSLKNLYNLVSILGSGYIQRNFDYGPIFSTLSQRSGRYSS